MDRRTFIGGVAGGFLAAPLAARAQQVLGKAHRLGEYALPDPNTAVPLSIFSYSGWDYDPARDACYMIGGGHSATPSSHVIKLDCKTFTFSVEYPPVPIALMRAYDVVATPIPGETYTDVHGKLGPRGAIYKARHLTKGKFWQAPGYPFQPISLHSYTLFQHSPALGKFVKWNGNNGSNLAEPVGRLALNGNSGVYDPATKLWVDTGYEGIAGASCVDPVSGNHLFLNRYRFRVVDPRTMTTLFAKDVRGAKYFVGEYLRSPFGIYEVLVYHPPSGSFTFINSHAEAFELALNRDTWSPMFRPIAVPNKPVAEVDETGSTTATIKARQFAYDVRNDLTVGGLCRGVVWALKRTASGAGEWLSKDAATMVGGARQGAVDTSSSYCWTYLAQLNIHIFMAREYPRAGSKSLTRVKNLYAFSWDESARARRTAGSP